MLVYSRIQRTVHNTCIYSLLVRRTRLRAGVEPAEDSENTVRLWAPMQPPLLLPTTTTLRPPTLPCASISGVSCMRNVDTHLVLDDILSASSLGLLRPPAPCHVVPPSLVLRDRLRCARLDTR